MVSCNRRTSSYSHLEVVCCCVNPISVHPFGQLPAISDREKGVLLASGGSRPRFPNRKHCHSMTMIAGWTPAPFNPDGNLNAVDPSLSNRWKPHRTESKSEAENKTPPAVDSLRRGTCPGIIGPPRSNSAATLQWGLDPLSCAIIFGGLNSMYVNPEVWLLPMRWQQKMVPLFSTRLESGGD